MPYSSQVCHIGLTVFLFLLLAQKGLEVHGRKLRRESFEELSTEAEEDVAAPVYYQGVDGQPGVDFPTLSYIPRTTFSCTEMDSGYYADTETGCQVFHICNNGAKVSFLCPNGTIFQQSELICEWWFKVNCSVAPTLYQDSAEQFQLDTLRRKESRRVTGTSRPTVVTQTQRSSTTAQSRETFGHQRTSSSRRNSFNTSPKPPPTNQFQENRGSTSRGPTVYKSDSQQGSSARKTGKNINKVSSDGSNIETKVSGFQRNGFQSTSRTPVSVSYEETQIPEESGSFVRSRFNSISSSSKPTTENPYPNHRKSYSDIQDPKVYGKSYSKLPEKSFYGTSLGPETLSTVPVLHLDTTVTQSPSIVPRDPVQKTTSVKDEDKTTAEGSGLNDPDATTISEYDVPSGFNVDSVAVVTTDIQRKIAKEEDIQVNTSEISTTESKLIFLKTTTQSPRSFQAHAERDEKSDKSQQETETPSLDFNVNSISVIPFHAHSRSTTDRNYDPSTTLNPSTEKNCSTFTSDNLSTTLPDLSSLVSNTLSPSDSTDSTQTKLDSGPSGSPRIGFDYFGTTESSHQQSTPNPNNFAREVNGVVYTTAFPRGFTLSTATKSDFSTIENRINNPSNKLPPDEESNSILDFTLSTVPTPYSTTNNPPPEVTDENMKDVINSLIKIAEERLNKDEEARFATNRPDLVVPPSVSPSTLHSLALYFANAADINHSHPEDDFMNLNLTATEERTVVDMLLTEATRVGYESLFKDQTQTPAVEASTKEPGTTTVASSTVEDEDANYPPQNTSVRELARLFTSALSSYLDDPENFRKTLQGVRPTEPPVEGRTETNPEDEEVLNFSDSDLSVKSPPGNSQSTTTESTIGSTIGIPKITTEPSTYNSHVVTSEKPEPTLGFVIAYDSNSDSDNSIDQNGENLQTADSQSFVSQNGNSLVPEKQHEQKSTLFDKGVTTYTEKPEPAITFRPRPTASFILAYGVSKSSTSTESFQTNFGSYTTERVETTSFGQEGSRSTSFWTTADGLPNNHWTASSDVTKLLQSALALDPLTVNILTTSGISGTTESVAATDEATERETSTKTVLENAESLYTEADGVNNRLNKVLMNIMKNTTNERERVRLILDKLNLTEDEFRNRMKEIESNPLAKRLVLLLVDRCNNKENDNGEGYSANEIGSTTEQITDTNPQRGDDNVFRKFVDENLTDENEDTRALQLLNSLYVIASKFNK
ncbi:mucin-3A-like isoform X2 [Agrilus planipennis]|uniref:Mucin-3A-like isoform X2 n=1 Tax=Agrilus planipennis TaxID=224129 RepID=A0A1W4WF56_AGRPL|nr:mucin-3A-like isoform X2 [Agrilus planipennis]